MTSLVVASQFRGPQATNGVLIGMLFRMALLPLAACLIAADSTKGEWLVQAGGLEIMVVYYLVTLSVETILSVLVSENRTIGENRYVNTKRVRESEGVVIHVGRTAHQGQLLL